MQVGCIEEGVGRNQQVGEESSGFVGCQRERLVGGWGRLYSREILGSNTFGRKRRVLCLSNIIPLLGEGAQCRDCSMPTVTHLPALALMLEAGFIRSGKVPR